MSEREGRGAEPGSSDGDQTFGASSAPPAPAAPDRAGPPVTEDAALGSEVPPPRPPWDRPEQKAAHPQLYDSLTLLPNQALLLDRLSMALTRTHRTGEPLAVVLCQVEQLPELVGRFGDHVAEAVLAAVARRLVRSVRTADTVARGQNAHFILLCERLARADDITVVLDRVHESMREPVTVEGRPHQLTVRLGAVITNDPMLEFYELIDEAEQLLARAAAAGTGRSAISDWSFQIFGQAAAFLDSRHDH